MLEVIDFKDLKYVQNTIIRTGKSSIFISCVSEGLILQRVKKGTLSVSDIMTIPQRKERFQETSDVSL